MATDLLDIDVRTHNGCLTITRPATGQHRTFRVHTEVWDKGTDEECRARVVSLKRGHDWVRFALIADGRPVVFRAFRTEKVWGQLLRLMLHPEAGQAAGLEYDFEGCCRRCNRQLTVARSIRLGIGPVCLGYRGLEAEADRLEELSDGALMGEVRSAAQGGRYEVALTALAFLDDPQLRRTARGYVDRAHAQRQKRRRAAHQAA